MASGSTARLAIPFPVGTDPNNIPVDLQALAARLDAIAATLTGAETLSNKTLIAAVLDAASSLGGVTGTTLAADRAASSTYVPAWSIQNGTGTVGPSIGNGTIAGRYRQRGKWVDLYVQVSFGTTTTFGSTTGGTPGYFITFPPGLAPLSLPVGVGVLNGPSGNAEMTCYWDSNINGFSALMQVNAVTYQWNQNTPLQVAGSHVSFSMRYEIP